MAPLALFTILLLAVPLHFLEQSFISDFRFASHEHNTALKDFACYVDPDTFVLCQVLCASYFSLYADSSSSPTLLAALHEYACISNPDEEPHNLYALPSIAHIPSAPVLPFPARTAAVGVLSTPAATSAHLNVASIVFRGLHRLGSYISRLGLSSTRNAGTLTPTRTSISPTRTSISSIAAMMLTLHPTLRRAILDGRPVLLHWALSVVVAFLAGVFCASRNDASPAGAGDDDDDIAECNGVDTASEKETYSECHDGIADATTSSPTLLAPRQQTTTETSQIRSQTDAILFCASVKDNYPAHKGGDTFGTTSAKDTGSNCHYGVEDVPTSSPTLLGLQQQMKTKTQIQPAPILTITIQQSVGIHAIYSCFSDGCSQTSNGLSAMAHNGPVRARDGAGFGVDDRVGDTMDVEVMAIYQGAESKVAVHDLNLGDSGVAFVSANGSTGSSASEVSLPLLKYPAAEDSAEATVPNAGSLSSPADCQAQCTELMLVTSTAAQLDRTTSHQLANSQPFLRLVEAAEHPDSLSYRSKMTAAQLEATGLPICRHYPAHFAEVEGHNCPVFKLRKMIEVGVSSCEGKWCSLGSAESSSAWYSQKRELGNGLFGLVDLYEREELGDDSDFQRNWL